MSTSIETATLPRSFRRIRLELARDARHPAGSSLDGYELVAPLDGQGHIDAQLWRAHRDGCRVRRFGHGEPDEIGHLRHKPGGAWSFHYDVRGDDEDEAGYRFETERFVVGEYVSVREDDRLHTFRVVSVEHV
jgi:hypothetical protein